MGGEGGKWEAEQGGGRAGEGLQTEGDSVEPQQGASSQEDRPLAGTNAHGPDCEDGEIGERYDHDTSAKSMTVCGVSAKGVSRVLDDRLADRLSGRIALRQAHRDFRRGRSLPAHPMLAHRPDGRPYLSAGAARYCPISHSHRFAVAAVALAPVGIAIEKIWPRDARPLEYFPEESQAAALRRAVCGAAELLTLLRTLNATTA